MGFTHTTTEAVPLDRDELLLKANMISQRMSLALNPDKKPLVRDQRQKLRYYKNAFLGSEAVGWAVEGGFAATREAATKLFDDFLTVGALLALSRKGHVFQDHTYLYSWPSPGTQEMGGARGSVSEEEEGAAIGDLAKLLHLHTAIYEKNKLRQEEWRKGELPRIRKRIAELEGELTTWRKKLEASVEVTKKNESPDVESLLMIDELESAVSSVTAELDNQKQLMHFPEPEGWVYRFGSDGVYVGIKHPYLEKIKAKWVIRAGSALSSNPAIKASGSGHQFEMKLAPVVVSVAFDGVSIVGEKGSGVPSFQIERLALNMELHVEAQLEFNRSTSTWKAPNFSFNLVDLGKTEVMGLPPALLQWVINKFAPSRVKKAILTSLPKAFGEYLAGGGEMLEMSGDFSVRGIPFAVLDAPMVLARAPSPSHTVSPEELSEAHWSALKLTNTGIDCIPHGHVLAQLRRRLRLSGLGRNTIFKQCSKWTSVAKLMSYVRTLDREAGSMEYSEIMRTWQHALNTVTCEDGLSPIDLQVLFDRLRLLDKVPFEVRYEVSEFTGKFEVGRLADALRDIGNEVLNTAKTDLTNVEVLNQMRQVRTFQELDDMHRDARELLKKVTDSVQKVSAGIHGRLLGGKDGIFDVGMDTILMRLKPGIQVPFQQHLVSPSDISASMYAVEDEGGQFVVDVGVPKSEKIAEDVAETKSDSLLSLCTGEFWKRPSPAGETEDSSEVYEGCKYFPTHDRVVKLTVGSGSMSLRTDVAALQRHLATLQQVDDGLVDLFSVSFKPAKSTPSSSPITTTSASPNPALSSPRSAATAARPSTLDATSSAPSTPAISVSTTGTVAAVGLSPIDLPPSTVTSLVTPTETTTIHLFAPTPTATTANTTTSVGGASVTTPKSSPATPSNIIKRNSFGSSFNLTPISTPTSKNAKRNSFGSPNLTPVSTPTHALSKRNSLGNNLKMPPSSASFVSKKKASTASDSDASKLPSYMVGLQSLPDLFAQLTIRDFHVMGAPRRISRFVRATIEQTQTQSGYDVSKKMIPVGAHNKAGVSGDIGATSISTTTTELKSEEKKCEVKNAAPSISTTEEKKGEESEAKAVSELDPLHVALHSVLHDIGSDSMLCRFAQSLNITVQDDKLFVTLSRLNKQAVERPFVFSNSYVARDLFEKVMLVQSAVEAVRAQS